LDDYTNSRTIETLGNNYECQAEVPHTSKTQVCVESKFQVLNEHELNNDDLLTIKQCLEDGEGKFLGDNFSSDFEDFFNYPIFSQEFYT